MQLEVVRTLKENVKDPQTGLAFRAVALAVKNLQNSTRYVIRQIISSFDKNELKQDLHEDQLKVLQLAEAACKITNVNKTKTNEKRAEKARESGEAFTPAALLQSFLADNPDERANPWQILDISLLDKVMQMCLDENGKKAYVALPAAVAQQAIAQVRTDFQSWFKALKAHAKTPKAFTGKPKMPSYKPKHSHAVVKFPYAQLYGGLIGIAGKELYEDYEKTAPLGKAAYSAYSKFDIEAVVARALARCATPAHAKVKEIRLVPKRTNMVVEVVVGWDVELSDECPLAQAMTVQESLEKSKKKSLSDIGAELLSELGLHQMPVSAGIDMGLTNLMTVVYTNGQKSKVISHRKYEHHVQRFDKQIDERQAKLAGPRMKELQQLQAKEGQEREFGPVPLSRRLSHAQFDELRKLQEAVQKDAHLLQIRKDREQWIADALHKLSTGVVNDLVAQKVQVLVIGHNALWKDEVGLGKKENRRFLATAHTRLIEHLRYKCEEKGILVVETEESYTSKTSFAKNEPLHKYQAKPGSEKSNEKSLAAGQTELTPIDTNQSTQDSLSVKNAESVNAPNDKGEKSRRAGVRCALQGALTKAKNAFVTKGLTGRWASIHADVNGAFNILRKFYVNFVRHKGLSSAFELWGLTHSGLTKLPKMA